MTSQLQAEQPSKFDHGIFCSGALKWEHLNDLLFCSRN
jgi:hypothetical protein